MRAAQIFEDLTLRVASVPEPVPAPGQVLVRVHAAGVCGTDLHILDGMIKPDPYPMILGHEAAGVVESAGDGTGFSPGDRVTVYNKIFCGACEQCLGGRHNICDTEPGQLGFNTDGGDAEYVAVPARNLVGVPAEVDLATAAVLSCAGMTAVHATRLSGLRLGQTAVVNGVGGVGVLVVQAARQAGARVIAESMTAGVRCLAKGGRFVSTGYTDEPLSVHPIEFILLEAVLVSTVAATRQDLADALRLAASGALTVPIASRVPLDGVQGALDALRKRTVLGRQVIELA
jgi:propanol-preferring alcohol dehydrogenase